MGANIGLDEHVFDCGRTGTGKTFLWKKYLAGERFVVVHDTKGTTKWDEIPRKQITVVTHLKDLAYVSTPKIIYRPVFQELRQDYYEAFYQWVYRRGHCRVVIDEMMNVCPNPFTIPFFLHGIYTRGRELGVTAWACSQRPKGVPVVAISEASHLFVFDLNVMQDRARIVEITGIPDFFKRPGKHNFWYYHVGEDAPVKARLVVQQAPKLIPVSSPQQAMTDAGRLPTWW